MKIYFGFIALLFSINFINANNCDTTNWGSNDTSETITVSQDCDANITDIRRALTINSDVTLTLTNSTNTYKDIILYGNLKSTQKTLTLNGGKINFKGGQITQNSSDADANIDIKDNTTIVFAQSGFMLNTKITLMQSTKINVNGNTSTKFTSGYIGNEDKNDMNSLKLNTFLDIKFYLKNGTETEVKDNATGTELYVQATKKDDAETLRKHITDIQKSDTSILVDEQAYKALDEYESAYNSASDDTKNKLGAIYSVVPTDMLKMANAITKSEGQIGHQLNDINQSKNISSMVQLSLLNRMSMSIMRSQTQSKSHAKLASADNYILYASQINERKRGGVRSIKNNSQETENTKKEDSKNPAPRSMSRTIPQMPVYDVTPQPIAILSDDTLNNRLWVDLTYFNSAIYDIKANSYGVNLGYDYLFGDNTLVGTYLSTVNISSNSPAIKHDSINLQTGIYSRIYLSILEIDLIAGFNNGINNYIGTLNNIAFTFNNKANYNSMQALGSINFGALFKMAKNHYLKPQIGTNVNYFLPNTIRESGEIPLIIKSKGGMLLNANAGLEYRIYFDKGSLLYIMPSYEHQITNPNLNYEVRSSSSNNLNIKIKDKKTNYINLNIGGDISINNNILINLGILYKYGGNKIMHINGNLGAKFYF